jgi:hypothetical protein
MEIKDIFGKPREGVHKLSFPETAVVDWVVTVILVLIIAGIISHFKKLHFGLAFLYTFLSIIPIFIFIHWIFGVNTRLNVWIARTLQDLRN